MLRNHQSQFPALTTRSDGTDWLIVCVLKSFVHHKELPSTTTERTAHSG
jgi:hypothetical protein